MDKEELRRISIGKRDSLTIEEITDKSRVIFEKLLSVEEYTNAENVLIYASMRSEVITDDIILDALACGKKVFCPKVTDKKNGKMEFVKIYSLEDLKEGYFGIREPEITDESEIFGNDCDCGKSIILVPAVAFDEEGNRIGYSGGFYDRFLEKYPDIPSIGLAFEIQIVESIPAEIHDRKVGKIITD